MKKVTHEEAGAAELRLAINTIAGRVEQLEKSSQRLAVTLDENNKRFELLFKRTESRVEALADDSLVGRGFSGEVSRRLAELEKPQRSRSHWPLLVALTAACALFAVLAWTLQKSIDRVAAAIISKQTAITVQPAPVALAVSGTGTVTLQAAPGDGKLHTLELRASEPCWIRVTELSPDKSVLWEASAALVAHFKEFTFDKETHVEVRSGCPGAISYRVNGVATSPTNNSGKPRDSEVVDLTL